MQDLELDVSKQLQHELEVSVIEALSTTRPILTHWNADTTWSLSLAYPTSARPPSGRLRYNILIDPWLAGPQSDVAGWFSTQWHAIRSSVQSVAELSESLEAVEFLASQAESIRQKNKRSQKSAPNCTPQLSYIDAVVVSHEFTDRKSIRSLKTCIRTHLIKEDGTRVSLYHDRPFRHLWQLCRHILTEKNRLPQKYAARGQPQRARLRYGESRPTHSIVGSLR